MHETSEWVLETAKDIDSKLCEWAEREDKDSPRRLEVQRIRVELIKAITDK